MNKVQWSWTCTLFANNMPPFKGTLRQALAHWDNLPARLRPSAHIDLDIPINGQTRLDVRALQRLVQRPDFLDQ